MLSFLRRHFLNTSRLLALMMGGTMLWDTIVNGFFTATLALNQGPLPVWPLTVICIAYCIFAPRAIMLHMWPSLLQMVALFLSPLFLVAHYSGLTLGLVASIIVTVADMIGIAVTFHIWDKYSD